MKENMVQMQVYYEIAMSIGNSLHLKEMIRDGLSAYLRKLNCSAGLVLIRKVHPDGDCTFEPFYSIPRNVERNTACRAALDTVSSGHNDHCSAFLSRLPFNGNDGKDRFFTILELPGFGLLILVKSGMDLDYPVIQSLKPLNEKMAKALIACLQSEKIEEYNEELKSEMVVRQSAEKALRDSEEKYRLLVENAPLGIISIDNDGRILNVNQKLLDDLAPMSREEVLSINALDSPRLIEAGISNNFRRCLLYEESGVFETEYINKWDRKSYFRYHLNPVKNDEGQLIGAQAIFEDISATKQLKNQLQHAQKMEAIGTLAGGIAHDFNNLLMAIQGNVSLILHELDPAHSNYRMLKNIENQVKSGAKLTGQVLGYARKGQYDISAVDLNKLIEETSDAFGRAKKETGITRALASHLHAIDADQNQIEQVMLNLLVNASDAMPTGGKLQLKTMNITHEDIQGKPFEVKSGEFVLFQITDEGEGMDEKTMNRIFEPFFTTKEMGRGTGLGLASVYGIVKAHGGYIDVESEIGRGTTFSIYFPASKKIIRQTIKSDTSVTMGNETILLVEDEEMVLEVGMGMLKKLGYSVLDASCGSGAVSIYKEHYSGIDLVILDIIMPGMGGGKVYDILKEINPEVKVLLASGYNIDSEATEILDKGCNGFIQKPFNMEELSKKVREVLDK